MMHPAYRTTLAALTLLMAPVLGPAAAQEAPWYQTLFAPDLIGKPVRNASGESLAKIEEVAIDPASSRLVAVLQSGGFMGLGGKHVVVPLTELQKQDTAFVLPQGSKQKLSARPDYDKAKYPPVTHFSQLGTVTK
jgi:hypothetical protein